jgi:hypothetical protein
MFKKITIDGKEIELAANAATPFRFKQVFRKDLFSILGNEAKAETEGVEAVTQLAFIMAKQAEKADMNKLNEDVFIEWLEDFGPMAFVESAEEILNAYMDSTVGTATP